MLGITVLVSENNSFEGGEILLEIGAETHRSHEQNRLKEESLLSLTRKSKQVNLLSLYLHP